MAKLTQSSDQPPSILSSSPEIASPFKTLDESSPAQPTSALVGYSLSPSSPIHQNQDQASSPANSLTQIQNPGECSSSPLDETLVTPSQVDLEENKRRDSQIMQQISPSSVDLEENERRNFQIIEQNQISPANNNNNKIIQIVNTSHSLDVNRDSYNLPLRRLMAKFDYQSDDDLKPEAKKPLEISWPSPKFEPTGVGAGLDNSGNTCFIASVLQCFTHTVPLIESLWSYKYQTPCNCGSEKFCVMHALRDHIELALRSSGYALTVDRFRDNLNHFSSDFQINHQEDAHEFLQSFLDKLERCCLDPRNRRDSLSTQDVNIVDHVFGGRLLSRLHCCNCNSFSDTFEPSLGWSLEIEDDDDLWSALESFTRVEKLEDQFTCDNCKEKVSKEKQLKLDKLPLVATFHLKRFKNDGLTMEKIRKQVYFPLELDLLPYMSCKENPEVSTKYCLYAFVEHLGNGVTSGHYSSYVRSAAKTWHNFDDGKVTSIGEDYVLTQNAYILFYAREGTKWFSTAFEELKPVFEATPSNFSPKSVLETTCREECAADHSYDNLATPNYACNGSVEVPTLGVKYSDLCHHEPQEEVYHSAESGSDDDDDYDCYMSDASDEFENRFAETSHQEQPNLCSAGNKAAVVPVLNTHKQGSSPKRKAGERAMPCDTNRPVPNIRKRNSVLKSHASKANLEVVSFCDCVRGSFQIQRSHLQTKRKQEVAADVKRQRQCCFASQEGTFIISASDVSCSFGFFSDQEKENQKIYRS